MPEFFREHGGAVLGGPINKYCYLMCRRLPPFFQHRNRIVYSRTELVDNLDDIQHPVVREALKMYGVREGVEIHHNGDLPAHSGIGSSSSFAVGLIHVLRAMLGLPIYDALLAEQAIKLERDLLHEVVGWQDQILAAHGGLNKVVFSCAGFAVQPLALPTEVVVNLEQHLMLLYTGNSRLSSTIAASYITQLSDRIEETRQTVALVAEGEAAIRAGDFRRVGELMHEGWCLKKYRGRGISTAQIDTVYDRAREAGAIGGKLSGAGGAGFMLLVVPPERQADVANELHGLLRVPFRFSHVGSQILLDTRDDSGRLGGV